MKQLISHTWLKGAMLASLLAGYSYAEVAVSTKDLALTNALLAALQELDTQDAQQGDDVTRACGNSGCNSCIKRKKCRYYCLVDALNLVAANATITNLTVTGNETLAGGLSITDSLFVGGDVFLAGNASFTDTTATFASNLSVAGNVSATGQVLSAAPTYAYAWRLGSDGGTIATVTDVPFTASTLHSADVSVTSGGTRFVLATPATYLVEFQVRGIDAVSVNTALNFQLTLNGAVIASTNFASASDTGTVATNRVVTGTAVVTTTLASDYITLRNVNGTTTNFGTTPTASLSASIRITRIN